MNFINKVGSQFVANVKFSKELKQSLNCFKETLSTNAVTILGVGFVCAGLGLSCRGAMQLNALPVFEELNQNLETTLSLEGFHTGKTNEWLLNISSILDGYAVIIRGHILTSIGLGIAAVGMY